MTELTANRRLIYRLLQRYRFHDDPEDAKLTFVSNFIAELPEKLLADFVAMFEPAFLQSNSCGGNKLSGEEVRIGRRLIVENGLEMGEKIFEKKVYKQYYIYTYEFGIKDEYTNEPRCTVCLEAFSKDSLLSRLPCFHSFHEHCLKEWLRNNFRNQHQFTCPICRNSLVDKNDETWAGLDIGGHLRSLC